LGKENPAPIGEITLSKLVVLSTLKMGCENYLFE